MPGSPVANRTFSHWKTKGVLPIHPPRAPPWQRSVCLEPRGPGSYPHLLHHAHYMPVQQIVRDACMRADAARLQRRDGTSSSLQPPPPRPTTNAAARSALGLMRPRPAASERGRGRWLAVARWARAGDAGMEGRIPNVESLWIPSGGLGRNILLARELGRI